MKNILFIFTLLLFSCQTLTIKEVQANQVPTKYILTVGSETHQVVSYHADGDWFVFACKGEKAYPLRLHRGAISNLTDSKNNQINF